MERGSRAFHICCDPDLEKFDNYFWKRLKIFKIDENIFEYRLKRKGKIINISKQTKKNLNLKKKKKFLDLSVISYNLKMY